MQPRSPKLLEHIATACAYIAEDTANATFAVYVSDRRLRQLVERNLEIVAEALLRLERLDPETVAHFGEFRKIIGMRNRISHEYDDIDHGIVWESTQHQVPALQRQAQELLQQAEREFAADLEVDI